MEHIIAVTVENKFGVLSRVAGLFSGRGFNIESLSVAPVETSEAVALALSQILSATDPSKAPDLQGLEQLPERPRRHIADLIHLTQSLDGRLPDELTAIPATSGSSSGPSPQPPGRP